MPRHLAFLLAVVVGAGSARAQSPPASAPDFERLFVRAVELHQAGDILGAIDGYKAALLLSPDRADALSNLGAAYVRLGQFEDAVAQYEAALKADPASTAIRLNLALAYYKSARPAAAIPQLKRVVASEPEGRNAYLVLGDCYLQTGQDQDVIALLKPREELLGGELAYAYILGTALLRSGAIDEGQKYVDRVFGAGESAEAHLLLGIAHFNRHDYKAAQTELERALQLNPRLLTANSTYGRTLLLLGNPDAAERAFRKELEANVNDFEANLQLGNIRKTAQRFPEATSYLQRAVAIRPDDLAARKLLAGVRLQTGEVEEAVRMFEELVKLAPDAVDVHVQLATGYYRLKRTADAERERAIIERLNAAEAAKSKGGS
jgi:tetratricopeptide (TPR) repeat protein